MLIKRILLLITFVLVTACSSDEPPEDTNHPLWSTSTYTTEVDGTSVELSLHFLDGVEDILQADVLIQRQDGSGPLFEVQDAAIEKADDDLHFNWTDGFENKGTAKLSVQEETEETVRLELKADEIINERNMMFVDDYVLRKKQPGPARPESGQEQEPVAVAEPKQEPVDEKEAVGQAVFEVEDKETETIEAEDSEKENVKE